MSGEYEILSNDLKIISKLEEVLTTAGFVLVTHRQLDISEIEDDDFDAVIIKPSSSTQKFLNNGQADAEWRIALGVCTMKGECETASQNLYEKMALVNRTIASDRTLNGLVLDMKVLGRNRDLTVYEPFAYGTVDLTIRYRFNERTQGG